MTLHQILNFRHAWHNPYKRERVNAPLQNQTTKSALRFYHSTPPSQRQQENLQMATNRYGHIWHDDMRIINIRFPSGEERDAFAKLFAEHHAAHDHDGEAPRFENVQASEATKDYHLRNYGETTIDGYKAHEILEYHEKPYEQGWMYYRPPTCCTAPLISLGSRTLQGLRGADSLRRHDLSAIFNNMPAEDFKSLLESVENEGFIDNVIRIYENKVLDGWHRYRAAKELNLLRKLRFQVWSEQDGDPKAFVYKRNLNRRHYSVSQRAQVAVAFNERFGRGRPSENSPNGDIKTRQELAQEAGVGTRTIDRAVQVEKAGQSEAVIAGEKTASQVITEKQTPEERAAAKELKRKKTALKEMWDARQSACKHYMGEDDTDLNGHLSLTELENAFTESHTYHADAFKSAMQRTSVASCDILIEMNTHVDLDAIENELRAIRTYAFDISNWESQDWILALIAEKKGAKSKTAEETATESEPDTEPDALQSLWERVDTAISKWKQKREGVSHASKTMLLHATLKFHGLPSDTPTTPDILEKLLHLLTTRRTDILEVFVKKQLRGESLWRDKGDDASGPAVATATETDVDTEAETDAANLVDEGLSGIDLHGLNDTLSALLESLNADEMSSAYKEVLTADLHDVFLQFEEVANSREMLIALLDAAQRVVSEVLP